VVPQQDFAADSKQGQTFFLTRYDSILLHIQQVNLAGSDADLQAGAFKQLLPVHRGIPDWTGDAYVY